MRQLFIVTLAVGMCASPAFAQQGGGDAAPAQTSTAPAPQATTEGKLKARTEWIDSIFGREKQTGGFYAEFGGLPPGSDISAGPGYQRHLFGGRAAIDGSAAISWSRGTFAQATFELPRLLSEHVSVGAQVKRQDFTRLSYFGIGPATLEADGTDYRLKNECRNT